MFGKPKPGLVKANDIFRFNNGDEVKDKISGFVGVVIARTDWFNGCVRYTIQSQQLKDNSAPGEAHTFDDEQLDLVKAARVVPEVVARAQRGESTPRTGGPPLAVDRGHTVSRR